MYKFDEYYDEPDVSMTERDHQVFQETLIRTRGLHNHFWMESQFLDLDGQVQKLTEYRKNNFLWKLTKILNLNEIAFEWPRISWEEIVHKHITIRQLVDKLEVLCTPASTPLEAALNVVEIPVEPVVAPYLRRNLEGLCPEGVLGNTILNNIRLRLTAVTREVAWASRVLVRSDEAGNVLPMYVTGRTLRRLLVTIVLKNEPRYMQHLWLEVHRDRERAEVQQQELVRSLVNHFM